MKKALFINGGAGRVLCAIPALEYYKKNVDPEVVIVAEAWIELFLASDILRDNVYSLHHKDLFKEKLKDKDIITPEPYRLNAYFNQKANLIQAFDMIINDLKEVPETKKINLSIGKSDQILGHNLCNSIKVENQKEKVIVFQPFGSGARQDGNFIIDESGRSFELSDVVKIMESLGKKHGFILMSHLNIPSDRPLPYFKPELNLLQWMGVINAADYFIGCDSIGQHYANALDKPSTIVIGSTFPENISYPENPKFNIIDLGKGKRLYSPLRLSPDYIVDRNNEDLMYLKDSQLNEVIKSVENAFNKITKTNGIPKQFSK